MKATITIGRDGLNRLFTVKLEADAANPIASVEANYDGFSLDRDDLPAPVTTFDRVYRKQESNLFGTRRLFVTATFQDGNRETAAKIWDE